METITIKYKHINIINSPFIFQLYYPQYNKLGIEFCV